MKKNGPLKKCISISVAVAFSLSLAASATSHSNTIMTRGHFFKTLPVANVAQTAVQPIAYLDNPNSTYYGSATITGWAISRYGIDHVSIFLDGKYIGRVSGDSLTSNAGVVQLYGGMGYSDLDHCNFSYTIDEKLLKNGTHSVSFASVDKSGAVTYSAAKNFTESFPTPIAYIDNPNDTYYGSATITGWAISRYGIDHVSIFLDGKYIGRVSGDSLTSNAGVVQLYGSMGYSDLDHCNFSYTIDEKLLKNGTHSVSFASVDKSGVVSYSIAKTFTENIPGPISYIDNMNSTYYGNFTITGWGISHYGIDHLSIFIDGKYVSGISRDSLTTNAGVVTLYGGIGYTDLDHCNFSYNVDTSSLAYGSHTISVAAIDKYGKQAWASKTFNFGNIVYKSFNTTLQHVIESNTSTGASDSTVNPTTIINNNGIFEFISLKYLDGLTADELAPMLKGCGVLEGHAQDFINAGKAYNLNPVYLIFHSILETGRGTSKLACGVYVEKGSYDTPYGGIDNVTESGTYYNLFGIHAYDSAPVTCGSHYAGAKGWNTISKAIMGGAKFISNNYVNSVEDKTGSYDQETLYEMRWNPQGLINHGYAMGEYATDPYWPQKIGNMIKGYGYVFNGKYISFIVPKYNS